jgi:hypothetical protein
MNLGKLGSLTTTSINSQISLNSPISLFYNETGNLKIAYERGNFVRYKALSAQHTWAYVSNSAIEV